MRKILQIMLKGLTSLTLRKHKPTIVAVTGSGQTSVARELIFTALHTKYPARRNLELPETEFSVPLTILDYPAYPMTNAEWFWALIRITRQLVTVKPYKHFLVLEISGLSPRVLSIWADILEVDYLVVVGKELASLPSLNKLVYQAQDIPGHIEALQPVLQEYNVLDAAAQLSDLSLPEGRINIRKGVNGSLIIDSSHYFIPVNISSIVEMVQMMPGRKVLMSQDSEDINQLQHKDGWLVNPSAFTPTKGDVVVVRGHKLQIISTLGQLFSR